MQLALTVKRKAPAGPQGPYTQTYTVEGAADDTVLDVLLKVRDAQDPTLAFEGNCLQGYCGGCAMRINGSQTLACTTPVRTLGKTEVALEPIHYIPVVQDLVGDMDRFLWNKLKVIQPWVEPAAKPAQPHETLMDPGTVKDLQTAMSCFMCGLCDEGCTVIAVDSTFLGPAVLTKAHRIVMDPRDTMTNERLALLQKPRGIWDCTHCFEANGHCPRNIQPSTRILAIRDMATQRGITFKPAARHHSSFQASVKRSGWLDEGRLAVESVGLFNIRGLLRLLPTAIRAVRRGKAPKPYLHRKRPGARRIKRIVEKVERTWR